MSFESGLKKLNLIFYSTQFDFAWKTRENKKIKTQPNTKFLPNFKSWTVIQNWSYWLFSSQYNFTKEIAGEIFFLS